MIHDINICEMACHGQNIAYMPIKEKGHQSIKRINVNPGLTNP